MKSLTFKSEGDILSEVKAVYSEFYWCKGGYVNGRRKYIFAFPTSFGRKVIM